MKKMKILLVEDSLAQRKTIVGHLEDLPEYEIKEIDNGSDAALIANDEKFDLIITDFNMPFMDGQKFIDIMREVKGPNSDTKILVLTAVDDPPQFPKDVKVFQKPFSKIQLLKYLKEEF